MSLSALSSAASTALSTVSFHSHGHRKGARPDTSSTSSTSSTSGTSSASGSTSGITIGQLPVGASTPLFNNILQSLQQSVGAATAVSGAAPSAATAAGTTGTTVSTAAAGSSASPANIQAFMHTLFQALKQDGLSAGNGTATAASASPVGAAPTATGGPYQANLVSSLQTLIGQIGSSSAANPTTANLNAAYHNLVSPAATGVAATSAASVGASSGQSSSAGLQTFLNNLLRNLQAGGVHSLSGIGNNINANV